MACGVIFFAKISKLKKIYFILFTLNFLCYYCSIDLKRQSELSGPRPDTSSPVFFQLFVIYLNCSNELNKCTTLRNHGRRLSPAKFCTSAELEKKIVKKRLGPT